MTPAIDAYNADAARLQQALDAMEDSEFFWHVRRYDALMALELGREDGDPADGDLPLLTVKAKTKRRYEKGSALTFIYVSREFADDDNIGSAPATMEVLAQAAVEELVETAEELAG